MYDFNLFNVRSSIEFVAFAVRVQEWMYEYQRKCFDAIMGKKLPMGPPVTETASKRNLPDPDPDEHDPKRAKLGGNEEGKQTEDSCGGNSNESTRVGWGGDRGDAPPTGRDSGLYVDITKEFCHSDSSLLVW